MTSYVVAHGWYESTKPEIVVPAGMKLSFLADVDLAGLHHIQAAQMIVGGVAAATTHEAGASLPNYEFSAFETDRVARLYGLNLHDLDLWVIGDQGVQAFALCDGNKNCTADEHQCQFGLLGMGQAQNVNHLHFMTCRVDNAPGHGPWSGDTNLHTEGGADAGWDAELLAWTIRFSTLDFDAQCREWEALDYQEKLYRTSDQEIEEWSQVYEAVKAHEADEPTFMAYLASMSGPMKERLLREHPEVAATVRSALGDTLKEYTEYADWFIALPLDEQPQEWEALVPEVRETALLEPRIRDWAQAYDARRYVAFHKPAEFRSFCATLTNEVRDLLLRYPEAKALYETP